MKTNPAMVRYCRKKLRKGRSILSQTVDYIALRGLIFMLCCMWFGANIENNAAKIILSIVTAVFISISIDLLNSLRLDSLIKKEREHAIETELNRRISLLSDNERNSIIRRHIASHRESFGSDRLVCSVSRPSGVSADDVIKAARKAKEQGASAAAVFYSGDISSDADKAAYTIGDIPFEFISLRRILDNEQLSAMRPTIEEADSIIVSHAAEESRKRKTAMTSPFSPGHIRRYLLCAACLTAMSFFVEYSLYFRLMAAACVIMGTAAWWANKATV